MCVLLILPPPFSSSSSVSITTPSSSSSTPLPKINKPVAPKGSRHISHISQKFNTELFWQREQEVFSSWTHRTCLFQLGFLPHRQMICFLDGLAVPRRRLWGFPWIHNKLLTTKSGWEKMGNEREREREKENEREVKSSSYCEHNFLTNSFHKLSLCLFIYLAAPEPGSPFLNSGLCMF